MSKADDTKDEPKPDKAPHPAEAALDLWIDTHLRNSVFSRDTDAWNHFQAGLPALRDLLRGTTK